MNRNEILKLIEEILLVRGYTPREDSERVLMELQRVGLLSMDRTTLYIIEAYNQKVN